MSSASLRPNRSPAGSKVEWSRTHWNLTREARSQSHRCSGAGAICKGTGTLAPFSVSSQPLKSRWNVTSESSGSRGKPSVASSRIDSYVTQIVELVNLESSTGRDVRPAAEKHTNLERQGALSETPGDGECVPAICHLGEQGVVLPVDSQQECSS